ncbi:MAG: hypothetical protein IJ374_03210 [Lachnospiraceae bacterium]|nr:hypothetical protein [Lachnospiraceae bacterium]
MKKNTNTPLKPEQKTKKNEAVVYTILERYFELCKKAGLIPSALSLDEKYLLYGLF